MSNKLQNIKAVQKMLAGEHRFQTRKTFSFNDKVDVKRDIGEKWEEYDKEGNVIARWEQMPGWRKKTTEISEFLESVNDPSKKFPNCEPDCKDPKNTRLDDKFAIYSGRCATCHFKMESKLKREGKYDAYVRDKMIANAEAFFRDTDQEMEEFLKKSTEEFGNVHADGTYETWSGGNLSAQQIYNEYHEYKNIVLNKIKGVKDEKLESN